MLPAPLQISPDLARRFHRRAVLLDALAPDIATAIAHHGFIQIDPINICGRMHDHILRNRVASYREGGLMRHLHGEEAALAAGKRTAFEHHLPDNNVLVAFSLEAWPHLLAAMNRRTKRPGAWAGKLTGRERELAERILAEVAARGPLSSADIDDDRRSRQMVWGAHSLAKSTLQKLFFHGRVLIARRENNRRLYDLPERILPPTVRALREPERDDTARWLAHLRLRQRRLITLKRAELPHVEDLVQPLKIEGCPVLYCLRSDVPLFDEVAVREKVSLPSHGPRLLAPLDPLIYDRKVSRALWDFDYNWEVYTPAHKRVRGYYALPILVGAQLVGHVDPKADRPARKLHVVSRRVRRGHKVAPAVRELALFLGLRAR